jgi:hypothetical protein
VAAFGGSLLQVWWHQRDAAVSRAHAATAIETATTAADEENAAKINSLQPVATSYHQATHSTIKVWGAGGWRPSSCVYHLVLETACAASIMVTIFYW